MMCINKHYSGRYEVAGHIISLADSLPSEMIGESKDAYAVFPPCEQHLREFGSIITPSEATNLLLNFPQLISPMPAYL